MYLDIKSKVQSTNAQIERETCKLDSQIQQLIQKQSGAVREIKELEGALATNDHQNLLK